VQRELRDALAVAAADLEDAKAQLQQRQGTLNAVSTEAREIRKQARRATPRCLLVSLASLLACALTARTPRRPPSRPRQVKEREPQLQALRRENDSLLQQLGGVAGPSAARGRAPPLPVPASDVLALTEVRAPAATAVAVPVGPRDPAKPSTDAGDGTVTRSLLLLAQEPQCGECT